MSHTSNDRSSLTAPPDWVPEGGVPTESPPISRYPFRFRVREATAVYDTETHTEIGRIDPTGIFSGQHITGPWVLMKARSERKGWVALAEIRPETRVRSYGTRWLFALGVICSVTAAMVLLAAIAIDALSPPQHTETDTIAAGVVMSVIAGVLLIAAITTKLSAWARWRRRAYRPHLDNDPPHPAT